MFPSLLFFRYETNSPELRLSYSCSRDSQCELLASCKVWLDTGLKMLSSRPYKPPRLSRNVQDKQEDGESSIYYCTKSRFCFSALLCYCVLACVVLCVFDCIIQSTTRHILIKLSASIIRCT